MASLSQKLRNILGRLSMLITVQPSQDPLPRRNEKKLLDARIVRNRLKVFATRQNAQATLAQYDEGISLVDYFWGFVDGKPIQNAWKTMADLPAETPLSRNISKDMKKRGFSFVCPTIIYAHMQATGMVNDHLVTCPRHQECAAMA